MSPSLTIQSLPRMTHLGNYKLVFLGDQAVGKTSIITCFMYGNFDTNYQVWLLPIYMVSIGTFLFGHHWSFIMILICGSLLLYIEGYNWNWFFVQNNAAWRYNFPSAVVVYPSFDSFCCSCLVNASHSSIYWRCVIYNHSLAIHIRITFMDDIGFSGSIIWCSTISM